MLGLLLLLMSVYKGKVGRWETCLTSLMTVYAFGVTYSLVATTGDLNVYESLSQQKVFKHFIPFHEEERLPCIMALQLGVFIPSNKHRTPDRQVKMRSQRRAGITTDPSGTCIHS